MRAHRLRRVRADLQAAALDAFVVTHPANVRYLTGLDASAAAVVITRDLCRMVVDFRYETVAAQLADVDTALTVHLAPAGLDPAIAELLQGSGARRIGVEGAWLPVLRYNRLSALLAGGAPLPLDAAGPVPVLVPTERIVERVRAVKEDAELVVLRKAAVLLSAVACDARRFVVAGRTEAQCAAAVDAAMRDAGFERPAFETIVASGPNSALPHARPSGRTIRDGEGVVLDFGGIYDGYCVDLTRTLSVGPMPASFRRLFDAVREAHATAIAAIRPGATGVDIDRAARAVLERHGLGGAFGHGTGHGLGLEVHEEPRISPLAPPDEGVVQGMVFTIEPGAYVPGVGGVRIEDDMLVTGDGCELLTQVPIEL